jgi:membrane protease YdiL (CAAX protease family)
MKTKGLYIAWISLLFTLLVVSSIGAIAQGDPEQVVLSWGFSDFGIFAVGLHAIGLCMAVLFLWPLLKEHQWSYKDIGLTNEVKSRYWIYAGVAVLLAFVLYPLVEALMDLVRVPMHWGGSIESHFTLVSPLDIICAVLGAVIIVPVLEEVIFRGYFLTSFVKNNTVPKAMLFSVLLFTSIHLPFGPGMMVYIFIWSWIPAYLYIKSKSIVPGMVFHFINNLLAYVVLPLLGF